MGILNKLFGFRRSLYIVRNGNELVYAMHENSVIRIVGYVMGYYAGGATPVPPWSLHLNFNKRHQSFELCAEHFTPDGENVSRALLDQIQAIDPGWSVPGGEPVFMEVQSKKQIQVHDPIDYRDLQRAIERLREPREPTFFSIMGEIFGKANA